MIDWSLEDESLRVALFRFVDVLPSLESPTHIERARKEFRVGNLYINRGITGAVVERQPFGCLKLSASPPKLADRITSCSFSNHERSRKILCATVSCHRGD